MDVLPKIGTRVRFSGNCATGPCTGTVKRIYKKYTYPEDTDWDSDENPAPSGLAPHRDWHAAVEVDEKPTPWPYGESKLFAPAVGSLEPM